MNDRKPSATQFAAAGAVPTKSGSSVLARLRSFLRTQYWIWPLVAAVILVFVGVFVRLQMEGAMKSQIAGNLKTILNANAEALRAWAATEKSRVESISEDARVVDLVAGLVQISSEFLPPRAAVKAARLTRSAGRACCCRPAGLTMT